MWGPDGPARLWGERLGVRPTTSLYPPTAQVWDPLQRSAAWLHPHPHDGSGAPQSDGEGTPRPSLFCREQCPGGGKGAPISLTPIFPSSVISAGAYGTARRP